MTSLAPSLERTYASRLDFSAAVSAGHVSLTTYQGQSSLAAMVNWFGLKTMDKDLRAPRKTPTVTPAQRQQAWRNRYRRLKAEARAERRARAGLV